MKQCVAHWPCGGSDQKKNIKALSRYWLPLLRLVIAAAGLLFVTGGIRFLSLGGSWYFLLAGAALGLLAVFADVPVLRGLGSVGSRPRLLGAISRLLAMAVVATVVLFGLPLMRDDRQSSPRVIRLAAFAGGGVLLVPA